MRKPNRLVLAGLLAGLALLTASAGTAATGPAGTETTKTGSSTLSAEVASTTDTGRIITSVTPASAGIYNSGTKLVTGIPTVITVTETLATGFDGWHVKLGLDTDLCEAVVTDCAAYTGTNKIAKDFVDLTGGTGDPILGTDAVTASLALDTSGSDILTSNPPTMTAASTSGAALTTPQPVFWVNQVTGGTYTGTYVGHGDMELDLATASYSGDTTTLTADFTVTLFE